MCPPKISTKNICILIVAEPESYEAESRETWATALFLWTFYEGMVYDYKKPIQFQV